MRYLDKQQLEDIMIGATLLGAGGGGSPKSASTLIARTVSACPQVPLVTLEEVEDGAKVCVVAGMGSPLAALKRDIVPELIRAFQFMEVNVERRKIDYVIPLEIGGTNTIVPMLVAAYSGARVVDADGAGRSILQLEMTTFGVFGVPISPLVVADPANNTAVIYSISPTDGEHIARAVSTAYANHAGIACYLMTGKTLAEVALAGTISYAGRVGKAIRQAREEGGDVTAAVLNATNGLLLARGIVSTVCAETSAGFDFGRVEIPGSAEFAPLRVITQNENMMAWREDRPAAIVPDLICFLDRNGQPLTNADMREGLDVDVIGIKAHPKWRQAGAFEIFKSALSRLGYTEKYVPLEDLGG